MVDVTQCGAVGDGVADDTDAIQEAIRVSSKRLVGSATGDASVYFPAGIYKVTRALEIPKFDRPDLPDLPIGDDAPGLRLYGAGRQSTTILANTDETPPFTSVFNIGEGVYQTTRGSIESMSIAARGTSANTVNYGIYGRRVNHWSFVRIQCQGFKEAGIATGYGWCNNFIDSEFSYNGGHGLLLHNHQSTNPDPVPIGGSNNGVCIHGCRLFANGGHGIFARSGYSLDIAGCSIEANRAGGIYLNTIASFRIQSYFEANAEDGFPFATPPKRIHADIIVQGAGTTEVMSPDFATRGGVIESCSVSPFPGIRGQSFVFDAGGVDIAIRGCVMTLDAGNPESRPIPLLAREYNKQHCGYNWTIENCDSFTALFERRDPAGQNDPTNQSDPKDQSDVSTPSLRIHSGRRAVSGFAASQVASRVNYAITDMSQWREIASGSASTFSKSAASQPNQTADGADVWCISSTAAGASHRFGFTINYRDCPNLFRKLVWFGIWICAVDGDTAFAAGYTNQRGFTSTAHPSRVWRFDSVSFLWPDSGSVKCGVYKDGPGSNIVYAHSPMLCEAGVSREEAMAQIPRYRKEWYGFTAPPAAGRWQQGDIAWRSNAGAGRTPGWVCTTAGTPGTWKAMANLSP